jgi:alpha-tubulin suppressor-like RCC1 family protein
MTLLRIFGHAFASLLLASGAHAVVTPLQGIASISVGTDFACAASQLGEVYCWGKNDLGQLGVATPIINDGGYRTALNPVKLPGLSGVVSVATGGAHACALRNDGGVWCWGFNNAGQTGQSGGQDQLVPAKVNGLPMVTSIYATRFASCAITTAAELWCWGDFYSLNGLLIPGRAESLQATPLRITGLSGVTTMAMSDDNACVVDSAGHVHCWGGSASGQIGDNNVSSYPSTPQRVLNVNDAVSIAVSYGSACAIRRGGALSCWGNVPKVLNSSGTPDTRAATPVAVPLDIGHAVSSIVVVRDGYCGGSVSGMLYCWGSSSSTFGAGDEQPPYVVLPGTMSPLLTQPVLAMAAGRNNACVVTQDSGVSCWGVSYGAGIGRFLYGGSSVPLSVLLSGKYGSIDAWIDVDEGGLLQNASGRLSRQDEIVVGIAFDSNSLLQSAAPQGTVDVLDGSTVVCANLRMTARDRSFEYPDLIGTPSYYTAKCTLPASARNLGVFRLAARFSGDANFSASSTYTNYVELVDGPARFKRVVEFQQTGLDYYFVTSRANEIALLDSLASQGWRRTGLTFRLYAEASKSPNETRLPVRRFYFDQVARNGGRGSHFYATAQPDVDALHLLNPQNRAAPRLPVDEGVDSYASPTQPSSTCGFYGWSLTVFRYFRTATDDPNHRYLADPATMKSLSASVWNKEGVAFCALP